MGATGVIALISVCAWMLILSAAVILLIRQVGLITTRLDLFAAGIAVSPAVSGPRIGEDASNALKDSGISAYGGDVYILYLSSHCATCRDIVATLPNELNGSVRSTVAVITGEERIATALADSLPKWMRSISGACAEELVADLHLSYAPFLVALNEHGIVTNKSHVFTTEDIKNFLADRRRNLAAIG